MHTSVDLNALVSAIGDAVVVCDAKGAITLWNPAAERLFGFTQAEALGASLDIIIPDRLRKRHWDGYHKTMETGITRYGHDVLQVPAIDKQGRTLSIAFTVAMLFTPDNKVAAIISIIRDDTRRFEKDRALRKKVQELEGRAHGVAAVAPVAEPEPVAEAPTGCPFKG